MASTNKTAHLALNQWVLSDPLLMEDMNEDNRKIDAVVGLNPWVRLMEATTVAGTKTVEFNLSGINISDYLSLRVYQMSNYTKYAICFRLNKITTAYQFKNTNGTWQDYGNHAYIEGGYVEFDLCGNRIYMFNQNMNMQVNSDFKPNMLQTIDLMSDQHASGTYTPGTRFVLLGVEK